MNKLSPKNIWLLTAGAFFAFFVFGFSDNLKGPVLPALLQDLQFNYAAGGAILMSIYIGFMTASLTAGFLANVYGQKMVLILAGVCLAIGSAGFASFSSPTWLAASMIVLGFGLGSLELGCNALIVLLYDANKGRFLNLMAVMHGMGSMIAPLYAGWMLTAGNSWRSVYRWPLILIGMLLIYFATMRFPKRDAAKTQALDFAQIRTTAFSPMMLAFYFAQMAYMAIELGTASWMVEFLKRINAQSINQSSQSLSIFFGLMMIGRLIGSFIVEKFGYLRSVLTAALAASACVAASLFGPPQFSWLLPVSGLFLSIIFPTITAAASNAQKENSSIILGLLFTFGGLGGIIGPWLIGIASNQGGLLFGFSLNLLFGLLTAATAFVLLQITSRQKDQGV